MGRGPSYPYVALEEAIALTRKMYDYAKRAPAAAQAVVTDAWKYSPSSSGSQKVLAALRSFGLVEDVPGTNGKSIKISPRGIRILLDEEDSAERKEEIRKAALAPKWYEYCWKTFGKEMPPSMRSNLLINHGFVDTTVEGFLKDYRKTITFAGLLEDAIPSKTGKGNDESDHSFKIGDWVQWESQGVLQFEAKRISAFYDNGKFATVEGSSNPIPVAELIAVDGPEAVTPQNLFVSPVSPVFVKPAAQGEAKMQTETFALSDGVTCQIQWPSTMSKESFDDFEYRLEGIRRRVKRALQGGAASAQDIQSSDETSS